MRDEGAATVPAWLGRRSDARKLVAAALVCKPSILAPLSSMVTDTSSEVSSLTPLPGKGSVYGEVRHEEPGLQQQLAC